MVKSGHGSYSYAQKQNLTKTIRWAGLFSLLVIVTALLVMPFFWMIITSLKPMAEVVVYPPRWLPKEIHPDNYIKAWKAAPFGRFYLNSVFTGIVTTVLQILFSLFMAYAFVFVKFPGKKHIFSLVLMTMIIPIEMKLIPNYILLSNLNWINTYWALIIPPAAHAFPVFVMYQQFKTFPGALIDSAVVDGANHLQILLWLVTPVSTPMLAAVSLVSFVGRWNDYLWPLIVTNKVAMRTLPVGLAYLKDVEGGVGRWNLLMAASVFVIIPVLVLFLFTQKQFVSGITKGAVKG
ncbi:MAG: carbohydrate ABC transporter permease [Spirochaetota bacterium]